MRYKNLIGDRYLELSDGNGQGNPLPDGATIPAQRTSPALDLDTLLNGFKPLFTGLDPTQINAVSTEIIQVFQGESGTVSSLLTTVGALTSTLADRDQLIGERDLQPRRDPAHRQHARRGSGHAHRADSSS